MNSRTTRRFRELFTLLPVAAQRQTRDAYRLFQHNPRHPGLHFKQVHPSPPIYSARIGIGYRAVGAKEANSIVWFWVGSHAEYDQLLKRL